MLGSNGIKRAGAVVMVFGFYLGASLLVALPQGLKTPIPEWYGHTNTLDLWSDTNEYIQAFGLTDPAAYAIGGREIVTYGWLKWPNFSLYWPPATFVIHAALDQLHAPVPLSLLLLSCLLWSCVFLQFYCFARRRIPPLLAAVLPVTMLTTEMMRMFFLGRGAFLSDGFGCPFFALGVGFLVIALEPLTRPTDAGSPGLRRTFIVSLCSGLCFVVAAYFRRQFEMYMVLVSVAVVLVVATGALFLVWRCRQQSVPLLPTLRAGCWKSGLFVLFVALAVFHLCTVPYRILVIYPLHGSLKWTDYPGVYAEQWQTTASLGPERAFFANGGGNWPAIVGGDWHVDAGQLTTTTARALTLRLLRTRPISWLRYKLPFLKSFWFARNCSFLGGDDYVENGIILLCFVVSTGTCLVGLFLRRFAGMALIFSLCGFCVMIAAIGPSMLVHFEGRYLHPLKVFSLLSVLYSITMILHAWRSGVRSDYPSACKSLPAALFEDVQIAAIEKGELSTRSSLAHQETHSVPGMPARKPE